MKIDRSPQKIEITTEMAGQRLDKALSLLPLISTRSRAENLIDNGSVLVNGKLAKSSYRVALTDSLLVTFPEPKSSELKPVAMHLDVLYEDSDLLVINKPAGLVVHPAAGHEQDTLVNALLHYTKDLSMKFGDNRPGIVHRLDRDTSGLLVVAKNDFAHEHLALQFRNKTAHRIYFAVALGHPSPPSGTIESMLARHPFHRKKFASVMGTMKAPGKKLLSPTIPPQGGLPEGKLAITHYELIKQLEGGLSYLRLKLETGRTHQIRVHLSEMGWQILADPIYGSERKTNSITSSIVKRAAEQFPRLALHAAELGFSHPRSRDFLKFIQEWPQPEQSMLVDLGIL